MGLEKSRWKSGKYFLFGNIGNLYIKKLERWLFEVDVLKELENLLKKLNVLYSKRRIKILDLLYDSGEIKDVCII